MGLRGLVNHLTQCVVTWRAVLKQEWTHFLVHTLYVILKNWYIELEVHIGMTNWEDLTCNFKVPFNFENEAPLVDAAL
jgi:hypothetical protein